MKRLFFIMASKLGAYATSLGGITSADFQVNAPGVGEVNFQWDMDRDDSSPHFGKLTGLTMAVQHAPEAGSAYEVLVRLEDGDGNCLGGATGTISGSDTTAALCFGDELDPKQIEYAIVVIDEG